MFKNCLNSICNELNESSIDFPRKGPSEEIWDKQKDGSYTLKESISKKILDTLENFENGLLLDLAEEIRVVGSICSNQYSDSADVDVHIVPDKDSLKKVLDIKEFTGDDPKDIQFQKEIIKWFNANRDEIDGWIGEHPIEVYLQLNPIQDMMSVGVYDVIGDKWLKKPSFAPSDVSPYDSYKDIIDSIASTVEGADLLFGELKRDVIDFETMKKALDTAPKELRKRIKEQLEEKLKEIEDSIEELSQKKSKWAKMRREASAPVTTEDALEDYEAAKKWEDANVTFKLLSRYKYLKIIGDLEKTLKDDGEVTPDELDAIKTSMK